MWGFAAHLSLLLAPILVCTVPESLASIHISKRHGPHVAISDFCMNEGTHPTTASPSSSQWGRECLHHRVRVSETCCVLTHRAAREHSTHCDNATTARIAAVPLLSASAPWTTQGWSQCVHYPSYQSRVTKEPFCSPLPADIWVVSDLVIAKLCALLCTLVKTVLRTHVQRWLLICCMLVFSVSDNTAPQKAFRVLIPTSNIWGFPPPVITINICSLRFLSCVEWYLTVALICTSLLCWEIDYIIHVHIDSVSFRQCASVFLILISSVPFF